mmetsp:Transcript_69515/g.157143  ORF Transcript_69515/g.157143 Transcript_69515/m.157143 type:complete len:315 (-) Transcript_69515:252-1196(-)
MSLEEDFLRRPAVVGPGRRAAARARHTFDAPTGLKRSLEAAVEVCVELDEREPNPGRGLAHPRERPLDRDRIGLAEQVAVQPRKSAVEFVRSRAVTGLGHRHNLGDCPGGDVCRHRDYSVTTLQNVVARHGILARVELKVVAAQRAHGPHAGVVARRVLETNDFGMASERDRGLNGEIHARAAGHVVQDERHLARVRHRGEVRGQARLRRLDVVGGDHERSVGAQSLRLLGCADGRLRADGSGPNDDWDRPTELLTSHRHHLLLLFVSQSGCLPGRAQNHDAVGALRLVPLQDGAQGAHVQGAVGHHWSRQRNQ